MARPHSTPDITPDILLRAYSIGLFPMAESAEATSLFWVDPEERGIIPLDALTIAKSLAKAVRSDRFAVTADRDFDAVVASCATRGGAGGDTWINGRIRRLYRELFDLGFAHSVECWRDGELAGGLYGVSLGGAFFGESMFHRERDASKVALIHLVARLRGGGYRLLDTQFVTPHLATLGAVAVPRRSYRVMLDLALSVQPEAAVWAGPTLPGRSALALAQSGVTGDDETA